MAVSITVVSPPEGTPITRITPLVVEVVPQTALQRVWISARFGGALPEEVVHDGGAAFAATFTNGTNARASISGGGYRFTLLRDGGWPSQPSLNITAVEVPDMVAYTYTATGAEGSDFVIPLPATRVDDNYVPQVTCGGVDASLTFDCPDLISSDRTTSQFRVIASAALQAGDRLDVVVHPRT